MKILMLSHFFPSHKGGIEIVAGDLFREFSARGHQVTWLAGNSTCPPESVGRSAPVPLRVFNSVEARIGLPFPIPTLGSAASILREVRSAQVVLLHDCLYLQNILAFVMARLRGVPTIIVQHIGQLSYRNPLINLTMKTATAMVTRPMLSHASRVIFISETTSRFFAGLRFQKSPELVFNGVDTGLYHPASPDTRRAIRRDFKLPEDRPVMLFVGRFVEKKGIAAMRHMVSLRPDWTWAFAGWGPLDPSSWNAPNVRMYSDLRGPSLAALYRACDALVLPSWGEGFPLVIQEALASGLPAVCAEETLQADPAMAEVARGAPLYPGDDHRTAVAFTAALEAVLDREGLRNSCRVFAASRYSWARAADRYLEILEGLLPPPSSAPLSTRAATGSSL